MNTPQNPSPFLPDTMISIDHCNNGNKVASPLDGARLAVKDLFHIKGMETTAGNPTWANSHNIPMSTNSAVLALLDAGAQFVGKTITDELAYSLNGQNMHYGTPINPVSINRLPGGSSSGSAVAVSSNLADIGLGTDTGGSIRVPASYNGLFGFRPTHGLIDCDNMVALAPSFDTIGWMTNSLSTLSKVAEVLLPKLSNAASSHVNLGVLTSAIDAVEHNNEITKWLSSIQHSYSSVLLPSITRISTQQKAGNDTANDTSSESLSTGDVFRILQGAEIWQTHGQWLAKHKPLMADDILTRLEWCKGISASQVAHAKEHRCIFIANMTKLFETVDIIILPTTPGLSPLITTPSDDLVHYRNQLLNLTAIAGLCGLPQLHLPLFNTNGAACGLSLIGKPQSDKVLINTAQQLMESSL